VAPERDGKPQHAADDNDQILKDAVMLLTHGPLTLVDERLNRRKMCRPFEQEPAEPFSGRIESWRVVQMAHGGEQFGEREAHWARYNTVGSDGVWRPGAGSSVTRPPTIARATSVG